jgi:CDGSH-type Zn-finger protein
MDPCRITPYEDGPLIVRGNFTITDQEGNEIEARRSTVALCRCGHSKLRPFCDGTHNAIRFRASGGQEGRRPGSPPAEVA